MDLGFILDVSKSAIPLVLATLALFQYLSANSFRKTQFLSELWRRFYDNPSFVKIFDALDRKDIKSFENISSEEIYKYLAFLEEITLFSRNTLFDFYKLRNRGLIHLFQYHFYNIYFDSETKKMFWAKILNSNLAEVTDTKIEQEIQSQYWSKQYEFALKCKKSIEK